MNMDKRFFCEHLPEDGPAILEGPEAHHLSKVMRLTAGDVVELFDGAGVVASAAVISITKRDVTLAIHSRNSYPPSESSVTLAVAVPKGERFDWLVEKATELGVTRLIPLRTARSVVDPRDSKLDRLRQVIIEASKQSRRPWMMELTAIRDFAEWIPTATYAVLADPSGTPPAAVANKVTARGEIAFIVGPEGGWTDEERTLASSSGAQIVSMGETILRTETAAIALAAWWRLQS